MRCVVCVVCGVCVHGVRCVVRGGGTNHQLTVCPRGRARLHRSIADGDMGHSRYNCMGNLRDDVAAGLVDVVVHMGDHCYDLGVSDDRRGDAYMNAFQPLLTSLPWFPIIGNHEWVYKLGPTDTYYGDGDRGRHYQAIAWGEAYGITGPNTPFPGLPYGPPPTPPAVESTSPPAARSVRHPPVRVGSTATTALGHHLATGTLYGMGSHGPLPSNTSRYTSADIGLIHVRCCYRRP